MKKIDENNFVAELKSKNEKAMDYLIDNYSWIIKTVISRNLQVLPNYKDDCMNDCLMAIWENAKYFDSKKSTFKNWVGGIAKYKCIDYKRKYLREANNINVDDLEFVDKQNVEEKIIEKEMKKEIMELLNSLPALDKNIFTKYYFEDAKASDIALDLEVSKELVYKRLSRGRKKLKSKIKVLGGC